MYKSPGLPLSDVEASPCPRILRRFPDVIPGIIENLTRFVCRALPSPPQSGQGSEINLPDPRQGAQSFLTRCRNGPIMEISSILPLPSHEGHCREPPSLAEPEPLQLSQPFKASISISSSKPSIEA